MPTAARQKYLAKLAAKQADRLSDSDRQAEYDKVFSQLSQINGPEVDKFEALMTEWVKDGVVRQGVIPMPNIKRSIVYSLGISRSKTFVSLKSDNQDGFMPNSGLLVPPAADDISIPPVLDDEQPPELIPSTQSVSDTTFGEITREMTNGILQNIANIPTNDDKYQKSLEELSAGAENQNGEQTTKSKPKKNNNNNQKTNQKKKQTFSQPVPRGSRHASRPPGIKPKPQSA